MGGSKFERGEEACVQNCVDRFFDSHLFIIQRYGILCVARGLMSRLQNRGQH